MSNIKIQDIYIYPIKSLGGIRLKNALLEERGLQHDRRWMLVDENNRFLSQREITKLTLFKLSPHLLGFKVLPVLSQGKAFDLPFQIEKGEILNVKVWDDVCPAIEHAAGSIWFSDQLNIKCKLVFMPDSSKRFVDQEYAFKNEITSFSDGYPLLLIGQASLDDLNKRIQNPVGMERFRPNLVTCGSKAFEEDTWKTVQVNSIEINVVKPCARCIIPSINPSTAELEKEPLATLSTFRKHENKIYFGQNLLPKTGGMISCGDEVKAG